MVILRRTSPEGSETVIVLPPWTPASSVASTPAEATPASLEIPAGVGGVGVAETGSQGSLWRDIPAARPTGAFGARDCEGVPVIRIRIRDYSGSGSLRTCSVIRRSSGSRSSFPNNQSCQEASRCRQPGIRDGRMCEGDFLAIARSFSSRSACRYTKVVSTVSWPGHSAITARSTPLARRSIAAV